ncbi:zinc-binding dehydrogenase [Zophobihabitans entericus]|uniref:Zinc-binding dehydrogenase n=1 Tax=Zophobihabitans entericus TaxID=1635327 RepID=A0A6G9I889_9GAMM|nr:zinc-binding dehydrogenase [Zophobihabitans entericus]QIQ20428.1 zinc-binding dehydrogenase [Zophobihabitans entericus]
MKLTAKSWTWQHKGEPTDLVLKDKVIPTLNDNEVLIKNTAIGLNPVDWKLIEWGHSQWQPDTVPGVDAAGVIIATGKNMQHWRIGTRVCYHTDLSKDGSFSTHTIVSGIAILPIPDYITDEAAAAFPCPSLTAWQAFEKIPALAGKTVLVSSAGGSVGYLLTQLLIQANARVYVTASTKHHAEFLAMGVIKAVDYKQADWQNQMLQALHGNHFDAAFDMVNGEHAASLVKLLGYYGHLVSVQDRVEQNPVPAFTTCVSLHEIALGAFHKFASPEQITRLMRDGDNLLKQIGQAFKQRNLSVDTFDNLPKHLAEMKKSHSSTKYIVKTE